MIKIFLFFILSTNVYALTIQQELDILAPDGDIRAYMNKCGYKDSSMDGFKKMMVSKNDTNKLDCLKSFDVELKAEIAADDAKRGAKVWHRANVVCANEATPRLKAECRIFQR